MLLRPCHRERHGIEPVFGGDGGEAFGRGQRLFIDEAAAHLRLAPFHGEIAREARAFGPGAAVVLARQHTTRDRRIGDQADAFLAADLRQLILEAAVVEAEVVLDRLVAGRAQLFGGGDRLHQAPARLVRTAGDADFPGAHQFVEHVHGFLVRGVMVGPVGLVEVDVVGLELGQAGFDGGHDVAAIERGHAGAQGAAEPDVAGAGNLGCHDDGVARLGLHPAADDFLGAADPLGVGRHGVAFGGIVEVDAGIEAFVENAEGFGFVGLAAEGHRAHADVRDDDGRSAETAVLHGAIFPQRPCVAGFVSQPDCRGKVTRSRRVSCGYDGRGAKARA